MMGLGRKLVINCPFYADLNEQSIRIGVYEAVADVLEANCSCELIVLMHSLSLNIHIFHDDGFPWVERSANYDYLN